MEEEHYMTMKIEESTKSMDRHSKLLMSRQQSREMQLFKKKQKSDKKSYDTLARKQLLLGLKTEISEDNKGFKMLSKMGYTAGRALGKHTNKVQEPVEIDIRNDRKGFGANTVQKFAVKISTKEQKAKNVLNSDEFRAAQSKIHNAQRVGNDLQKAQRICQLLDQEDKIEDPVKTWFWPDVINQDPTNEDEEPNSPEVETTEEIECKLKCLNTYLREKYNYCIWCAIKFEDFKDMEQCCPGDTWDQHENT